MKCITASCVIEGHAIVKNGKTVFRDKGAGVDGGAEDHERAGMGAEAGGLRSASAGVSGFERTRADLGGFLQSVYQYSGVNYPRFYKMDNLSKLGWLAAELLLQDGFQAGDYRAEEIGIVLANANASLDTDLKYFDTVKEFPSPSLFVYTLPNIMIGEICIRKGFKGENAFFVSDLFDADLIVRYVSQLLDNDILQACVCGWVDLLGAEYKAALFLVEKVDVADEPGGGTRRGGADEAGRPDEGSSASGPDGDAQVAFTVDMLNKIFSGKNGQVNG